MIARRQPMANDLRHVMTVIKIASDLERIGDLAKNIAKRAIAVAHETPPKSLLTGLGHMTEHALGQLKDVLDAYAARDADKAMAVWHDDARIDLLYNSLFREMLTYMMEDPRNIGMCTHLLFGAKNIERIGDHTTNIAENIHYLVHGVLAGRRPAEGRRDQYASSPNPSPEAQKACGLHGSRMPTILIVEDEARTGRVASLQSGGGRFFRARRDDRSGRRRGAGGGTCRSCPAGLDAARDHRDRALPPHSPTSGDAQSARHHADGTRRRSRPHSWPVDRRRRLRRQAVLGQRSRLHA